MCRRLELSGRAGLRSQPAAPRAHLHSPARKRASISCSFCCRPQVQRRGVGKHYMGRSMTARREARQGARSDQPRACSSRPYTGTELAARCTTRCCLLLLPAGLFDVDDLSDVASLIASLTAPLSSDPASDLSSLITDGLSDGLSDALIRGTHPLLIRGPLSSLAVTHRSMSRERESSAEGHDNPR